MGLAFVVVVVVVVGTADAAGAAVAGTAAVLVVAVDAHNPDDRDWLAEERRWDPDLDIELWNVVAFDHLQLYAAVL